MKEELPHGQFGMWLAMEFDWTNKTAQRFMNVASSFKNDNLSNLNIGASALYMLSEPSTPETAREEAIERAESGESISYSTAKEITNNHKEREPRDIFGRKIRDNEEDTGYDIDDGQTIVTELPDNVDPEYQKV